MCIAIVEVKRNDSSPIEFINFNDEADFEDRLMKLQASETVERIKIYKPTQTLTKQVTFVTTP